MNSIVLKGVKADFIAKKEMPSGVWERDFDFKKDEHVHVVAPSGSGKTSLIHFLYGIRSDYSGKIFFDNRNIKEISREDLAQYRQKNISIVFQDLKLFLNHTIRENLEIKRILQPYHKQGVIEEMADRLGIGSRLDQPVRNCSYGEQQRAAIIRALLQPFDFLLLDEPFSHLDAKNKMRARALIYEECARRGASLIFAGLDEENYMQSEKILFL